LAEHYGAFLCNPWLGQDVQSRFQSDGTLAALTWRGHEPLHVFFDPFFIVLEDDGRNLGNEALIFHEALHGFTNFPDEVLMPKLGVSGQTCGVEALIKDFVLPFAVPPINPYVAWNCPR
jgi:hypothetical protein